MCRKRWQNPGGNPAPGERSQYVPAMGSSEEAGQRCFEGERFGLNDPASFRPDGEAGFSASAEILGEFGCGYPP